VKTYEDIYGPRTLYGLKEQFLRPILLYVDQDEVDDHSSKNNNNDNIVFS